jgi:hypothetical protein
MAFRLIGHPDLVQQVDEVRKADPKEGPDAVARIRGLLESFDEDPAELEPAPVAQREWDVVLNVQRGEGGRPSLVRAYVAIYIYEAWSLRFAIARVKFPGDVVVGAWLMVETRVAAARGLESGNLCLALLTKMEELIWPI